LLFSRANNKIAREYSGGKGAATKSRANTGVGEARRGWRGRHPQPVSSRTLALELGLRLDRSARPDRLQKRLIVAIHYLRGLVRGEWSP